MSFYSREELQGIGFKKIGANVLISKKSSIYNPENIIIGSNVRIDDFCVLSAGKNGIKIGNYVHIAVFCSIIGKEKITISDFSGLSSRVAVYSSSDDYSGEFMTNPTVPSEFTHVQNEEVFIGKHVIVGSGSVILPGSKLNIGVAVAALSLIVKDCKEFSLYSGVPAQRIKERKREFLKLEQEFLNSEYVEHP